MKENNSTYGIFTNKKKETLAFYPCPKNANSSTKLFLIKHLGLENKYSFIADKIPRYKQTSDMFLKKNKINVVNFLPNKQSFQKINTNQKCCIIRDPVSRFISAYKNRILYHKDLDFSNHSIDLIIEKLENKLFENLHFLPQSFFFGNDLSYFTIIGEINKINIFANKINNFFGKVINFPKIQTGGNKILLKLNNSQIKKIKKIYSKDYNLISEFIK